MTNQSSGTISGVANGVVIEGGTGSVINGGNIHGTAASGNGAVLLAGGTVINTGTISGGSLGVYIDGGAGSLTNSGAISGTTPGGVAFAGGGTVNNKSGGDQGRELRRLYRRRECGDELGHRRWRDRRRGDEQFGRQSQLRRRGCQPNRGNDQRRCGWGPHYGRYRLGDQRGQYPRHGRFGEWSCSPGGGTMNNTKTISGGYLGVYIGGGAGAVTNSGAITGTTQGGVAFSSGGAVTNQSGGTITGAGFGVDIGGRGAAKNEVTNAGRISASGTNSIGVNLGVQSRNVMVHHRS